MTDMSKELNFETIARGRKADKGHTMVAVAETTDHRGFSRTHTKCQCGKIYSGWGDGGYHGHERHLRNELAKAEDDTKRYKVRVIMEGNGRTMTRIVEASRPKIAKAKAQELLRSEGYDVRSIYSCYKVNS